MPTFDSSETVRFGDFELDVAGYELRYRGRPVRLERQPMDLLMLLISRHRQVVLRQEIVERLWSRDVFVDVERGVNTAVRKIRRALRDSPVKPACVETVAGRGYRFIADIEVVATERRLRSPIRLGVLPFESLGLDPALQHLGDGLTDEIIASLGHVDPAHLSTIGRTSVMAYRRTEKSLALIGQELGVDFLLEGSIRSEQDSVRVTVKLIRVRDQAQVWSMSYNRESGSILALQQELSRAIVEQVQLKLSPQSVRALIRRQTRNADAYDLYLRARRFWHQLTPETTRAAVECFARATELDPDYALAWAGMAEAYASSPINGDADPRTAGISARHAARAAIRSAPDLAEVQHSWGHVNFLFEWNWPAAAAAYRRALALDSSFAPAHSMLGHVLSQMGRHDEALRAVRGACEVDPLSALAYALSSQVAFQARDFVAAAENAQRAIAIDPEFWVGHMMKGQAHEQLGRADVALEALNAAGRLSGGNSKPIALRGYLLARLDDVAGAREVLNLLHDASKHRYVPPYAAALVHAGLGESSDVFTCLDHALAARDVHLVFLTADPKWDGYRADPRFQHVLDRCGYDAGRSAQ
jgi:TolB-like protein/Tfp pilus assembly protein PilF